MTFALISGTLSREPEQRTAKSGQPFVTATLRVRDGNGSAFWRLFAYDEGAQAELMALRADDGLAAQGPMSASLWTPEGGGAPRLNLSLIVDGILPVRRPKAAAQKPKADRPAGPKPKRSGPIGDGVDVFGDVLPF